MPVTRTLEGLHCPPVAELIDPAASARFMNNYAARFSAGAFGSPTRAEVQRLAAAGEFLIWDGGCAAVKTLTKPSTRRDFTGREYRLSAPAKIITHIASEQGRPIPDLTAYSTVYAYREDAWLSRRLEDQGREVRAVRISASSEIIGAWTHEGTGYKYPDWEAATVRRIRQFDPGPAGLRERILAEVSALDGWLDDFPFYSDGSWSALNLRGFKPSDPAYGIKPSEMSKAWQAANPADMHLTECGWTTLADRCPAILDLIGLNARVFGRLERVRLLQMSGRGGRGGKLSRHSDVTDRAAGTRDGAIARFHIPLITHPDITMRAWDLDGNTTATHLEPWACWYLDARKPHAVTNPTGVDRIHLVVDTHCDQIVRDAICDGYEHVV